MGLEEDNEKTEKHILYMCGIISLISYYAFKQSCTTKRSYSIELVFHSNSMPLVGVQEGHGLPGWPSSLG
jgi:hypothetical protein